MSPLIIILALSVVAAGVGGEVALRHVASRDRRPRQRTDGRQPTLTARRAQAMLERFLYRYAPAAVAGTIFFIRGEQPVLGILVFVAVLLTGTFMWPARSPIHLMPVARTVLRFLLPAGGIAIIVTPGLLEGWDVRAETALAAMIGAWIIVAFGIWLEDSFDKDRPVRLAVIGGAPLAKKLVAEMRVTGVRDYILVGYLAPESDEAPDPDLDLVLPCLGDLSEVREVVQIMRLDLLVVGPGNPRLEVFRETANACLDLPVRMIELSAFYEDVLGHVPIGQINAAWFQAIMHPRYQPTSPLSKRVLDLVVAVPLSVLVAPLLPILALAVLIGSGRPILFRQRRVGEQGREFEIVKLRTMRNGARELAGEVAREKLMTGVGRFLRKTHFDELPQLWNVLKGDMTIVGPRPEQPALVEELSRVVPYYARRSLVRPGVTGWAQVRCGYAGSQAGTAWKICHDLYYVKRRSLVFDALIILQTIHVLVERSSEDVELATPAEEFILGEADSLVAR